MSAWPKLRSVGVVAISVVLRHPDRRLALLEEERPRPADFVSRLVPTGWHRSAALDDGRRLSAQQGGGRILPVTRWASLVVFAILLPAPVRRAARTFAVGALVVAAVFFLAPEAAISIWPWELTPLTSRVLGSFTAQVGVGALP